MTVFNPKKFLLQLGACRSGVSRLAEKTRTPQELYEAHPDASDLMWFLRRPCFASIERIYWECLALDAAQHCLPYIEDEELLALITAKLDVLEQWTQTLVPYYEIKQASNALCTYPRYSGGADRQALQCADFALHTAAVDITEDRHAAFCADAVEVAEAIDHESTVIPALVRTHMPWSMVEPLFTAYVTVQPTGKSSAP